MRYGLDEKPPLLPCFLYGLQWWVVSFPFIIIMGLLATRLHHLDAASQIFYIQKLFILMGAVTILQVFCGHRLPLVVGPAATLLVGLAAASNAESSAIYTAVLTGGVLLTLFAGSGAMSRLRFFFTPRIVAVILMLIAFTLTPVILRLVFSASGNSAANLCFALFLPLILAFLNARLPGVLKALTVFFGIAGGSLIHFLLFGFPAIPALPASATSQPLFLAKIHFDAGIIISFFFCFLALAVNELGSIESIGQMLTAGDMHQRIKKGAAFSGVANIAAGALAITGPVDYSLSAGVINATGCASRYPLAVSGLGLFLCGLCPQAVVLLTFIPSLVMGSLMIYLMAAQLASGLSMLSANNSLDGVNSALTVSLPLMSGLFTTFLPPDALSALPTLLHPVIGNGFIVGIVTVVFLEHIVFRSKPKT